MNANEMFPGYDKAVVLDSLGYLDNLMVKSPEEILKISDWMNLPLDSIETSLNRFKKLLGDAVGKITRS